MHWYLNHCCYNVRTVPGTTWYQVQYFTSCHCSYCTTSLCTMTNKLIRRYKSVQKSQFTADWCASRISIVEIKGRTVSYNTYTIRTVGGLFTTGGHGQTERSVSYVPGTTSCSTSKTRYGVPEQVWIRRSYVHTVSGIPWYQVSTVYDTVFCAKTHWMGIAETWEQWDQWKIILNPWSIQ